MEPIVYRDWREKVVFAPDGPRPQRLLDCKQFQVVLVGLEPGQQIPVHPAPPAVYYVLEGRGWMTVSGRRIDVGPGVTVVVGEGEPRGFEAQTRLSFIGARGAGE